MMTILASIGIGALGLLGLLVMFAIASAFERLKRIEAAVDRMEAKMNTNDREAVDE